MSGRTTDLPTVQLLGIRCRGHLPKGRTKKGRRSSRVVYNTAQHGPDITGGVSLAVIGMWLAPVGFRVEWVCSAKLLASVPTGCRMGMTGEPRGV